jgi:SAM-dependent methyltransferase
MTRRGGEFVEYPTASDVDMAKLRLLYRIPTSPRRGRVLELSVDGKSILQNLDWKSEIGVVALHATTHHAARTTHRDANLDGSRWCIVDCAKTLPFCDGYFDIVILHRTLDYMLHARTFVAGQAVIDNIFAEASRVLTSGGVVSGCVENRHSLARALNDMKRAFGFAMPRGHENDARPRLSAVSCREALIKAGFAQYSLFGILPSVDFPRILWSVQNDWSPRACRRQVEFLRPLVKPWSYAVWRMLAEIGVTQNLCNAIFFWGRKSC